MGFGVDTWAKVWEIERRDNVTRVRISTSRKNRETGEYVQDFGGYVSLVGEAHKKAANLKERDTIKIKSCNVENSYNRDTKVTNTYYTIFSYDEDNRVSDNETVTERPKEEKPANKTALDIIEEDNSGDSDDELPF